MGCEPIVWAFLIRFVRIVLLLTPPHVIVAVHAGHALAGAGARKCTARCAADALELKMATDGRVVGGKGWTYVVNSSKYTKKHTFMKHPRGMFHNVETSPPL